MGPRANHPTFAELVWTFARIGWLSFGGPAGQIALMHKIVVEEKRWISDARFLHALSYCTLLPGPEAQQLATYIGWLLHRIRGGLAAGLLFIAPGAAVMWLLSSMYARAAAMPQIVGLLFGIKCAVVAIVVQALVRLSRRALASVWLAGFALSAFIALFFFDTPFPAVVLAMLLLGAVVGRFAPEAFRSQPTRATSTNLADADDAIGPTMPEHARPSGARSLKALALGLVVWIVPLALVVAIFGTDSVFADQAWFFGKAALVTFGGAYAVLSYVADEAVRTFAWLEPGQMIDGLGLAETTPGPLILVLQFVGYLGAFRHPGALEPATAGLVGSLVVLWATFVPCFTWIFAGAPWIESVRANRTLSSAMSAVTAAVVGVIANLSAWFALHVLFQRVDLVPHGFVRVWTPAWSTFDPLALLFAITALGLLAVRRVSVPFVVALAAGAGYFLR